MECAVTVKGWISGVAVFATGSSSHPDFTLSRPLAPIRPASGNVAPRAATSSSPSIRNIAKSAATAHVRWRANNPGYWKRYRAAKPDSAQRNRTRQRQRDLRQRVASLANNNSALDLKSSVAAVWWLGPVAADLANNNLAAAQVFILPSPIRKPHRPEASCKQHPSGMNILLA